MEILELINLFVDQNTAGAVITLFMTLKGFASVIANNFNTQDWGKAGDVVDWLASNNKKAKLTGDLGTDDKVLDVIQRKAPTNTVLKVLKALS